MLCLITRRSISKRPTIFKHTTMKGKFLLFTLLLAVANARLRGPPDPERVAAMARYIIHNTDWTSIATISTLNSVSGYPFVTLKSMSDGPINNGTGIPYLYMTDLDLSGKDVKINNNVTIMCSLAETDYCRSKTWDPQDPRCAKVIITGKLIKVPTSSSEYTFGKDALIEKHPSMRYWPKGHGFYVAKIKLQQVAVLDHFGGAEFVPLDKYFHPDALNFVHPFDFEEVLLTTSD